MWSSHVHTIFPLNCCISALLGFCQETSIRGRHTHSYHPVSDITLLLPFLKCIWIRSAFLLLSSSHRHCAMSLVRPDHVPSELSYLACSILQCCLNWLLILQPKSLIKHWIPDFSWKINLPLATVLFFLVTTLFITVVNTAHRNTLSTFSSLIFNVL